MDAQRGRTNRRSFLLTAGLPLLAVGGGMTYLLWPESDPGREPDWRRVRTDLEPLNKGFGAYLGELTDAHWLGYDVDEAKYGDRSIPSPDSRIRLVGVAHLAPGGAASVVGTPGRTFAAAVPSEPPTPLAPYLPADQAWQRSPEFDAQANSETSGGYQSGEYLIDVRRDLVYFDVLYFTT
ncbi:hypothetical protein OG625_34450 [Streptomyces sp. NBC_01351]|uniref:hypothetical protein n=1 Tax=Streptomyces sp. NBC_01351 TaxID=2903833 RepID=UPI002E2EA66A|nr:hypothetical protein [Streptomyces sp. NBC_01351]